MDSANDVYIIVRQSGPQGTEDQKLYFKRGALPFLSRVSFCSAIVVCVRIHSSGTELRKMYPRDLNTVQCRPLNVRPRGGVAPAWGGGTYSAGKYIY
jgi:hypothetical protein